MVRDADGLGPGLGTLFVDDPLTAAELEEAFNAPAVWQPDAQPGSFAVQLSQTPSGLDRGAVAARALRPEGTSPGVCAHETAATGVFEAILRWIPLGAEAAARRCATIVTRHACHGGDGGWSLSPP